MPTIGITACRKIEDYRQAILHSVGDVRIIDHSLTIDPKHTKTLLNQGIVRAFGKQDLAGATDSWQRVMQIAPDSPEGQSAKRALDSLRSAHPTLGAEGNTPKQGA